MTVIRADQENYVTTKPVFIGDNSMVTYDIYQTTQPKFLGKDNLMTVIRADGTQGCTNCQRNDLVTVGENNGIASVGNFMTDKKAGLPVWAWTLIGVAVVALLSWVVWPKKQPSKR